MANMTQAKTPDEERDWDSIDIYLFSNGQEYSPPRKYHLRADELNLWDTTLLQLAKSQYGFMHSPIQLYTLDGHKVEGPLELANGGAYVAVQPPDMFIDSGYDKYLIKASRSWEKRQAKKSSSNEVTQDSVQPDLKADGNASDQLMSIKAPEESFTLESVINQPIKPPNVPEVQQQQTPKPATSKNEKKRTSLSQRVTTFRKVIHPPPTQPVKKLAIKTSPPKKITKPIRPVSTPQPNMLAKSRMYAKSIYNKNKGMPIDRSKVVERKSTSLTRITSNYKMMATDSTPMDNVIGDKELILISNMYKNPDNDSKLIKVNSVKKEQAGVQYSPEIIRIDEEIQSVLDQTAETAQGRFSTQKEDIRNNKIRIVTVTPDSNNVLNPVDDNYVTFMNKGDVVNLRLMIEVRNVDNLNLKYRIVRRSQSVTNVSKPPRESQYNMEDEVLIQSKSLQSLLENEYSQSIHTETDTKVVVVRCGCRQYETENDMSRANESTMCACNKRLFVLLPKWEDNNRCNYDEDTKQNTDNCEQKNEEIRKSNIATPAKQTFTDISSEKMTEPKNMDRRIRDVEATTEPRNTDRNKNRDTEAITEPYTERKKGRDIEAMSEPINTDRKKIRDIEAMSEPINTDRTKNTDAIFVPINKNRKRSRDTDAISDPPITKNNSFPQAENTNAISGTNSEYANSEYTTDEYIVTKQVITEDQDPLSGTGHRSSIVSQRTEYIVRRKNSLKEPKTYEDNGTQTDLSDILLEARRHEDGRYTFHLPSLYTLKQHQL